MGDERTLEELKELGAGKPAPVDIVRLYRQAFREFGAQALWSRRPSAHPTIACGAKETRRRARWHSRSKRRAVPLSETLGVIARDRRGDALR
jgi:hypothetical protein